MSAHAVIARPGRYPVSLIRTVGSPPLRWIASSYQLPGEENGGVAVAACAHGVVIADTGSPVSPVLVFPDSVFRRFVHAAACSSRICRD
ncbi:DUF397 domain-containing protein [Streptomyces sp. RB6PN25]|uniref:DUF397 domain-containing protein n=1 Tax=Streptomyces humicola TaxID=2953240 RepID=A0ABT1Q2Q5_9ACTN|nr:DUF397 domain-containing protein [Streptomyces humicola]